MKRVLSILLTGSIILSSMPAMAGDSQDQKFAQLQQDVSSLETRALNIGNGILAQEQQHAQFVADQADKLTGTLKFNKTQSQGNNGGNGPKGPKTLIAGSAIAAAVLLVIAAGIICKVVIDKKKKKSVVKA